MFTQDRPHTELFFGVPVLFIVPLLALAAFGVRKFRPLISALITYLPSTLAQLLEVAVINSLLVAIYSDITAADSLTHTVVNENLARFFWVASLMVDVCGLSVLGLAAVMLVEVFILGRMPSSPESLEVAKLMHQLVGLGTRGADAARSFSSKHWPASLFRKVIDPVRSSKAVHRPTRESSNDRTGSTTTSTAPYRPKNATQSNGRLGPEGFGPWDSLGL
ncbi:hypothetical protein LTR37_007830 [Vermiconidia calcicola]|uniref:Uncharacterized protein n=1 Tax=Vermiconidia calcicola TaxID=1690605 RepID=A0ACC3NDX8_9PEZI|nr:hypothetical protein LTR37_007830 [Vermiconidia calcicola]